MTSTTTGRGHAAETDVEDTASGPDVADTTSGRGPDDHLDADLPLEHDPALDHPRRRWGVLLMLGSAVGFLASMVLTIDRIRLLSDPEAALVCDINPFVTCGPVMSSAAGELFGFPNPLLGIGSFALVGALGAVVAFGGRLPRFVLLGLQGGVLAAAVFISWLQFQSLHVINALCLWCMAVWAVTIPIVVTTTVTVLRTGALGQGLRRVGRSLHDWQGILVLAWYVVVVALVLLRFASEFARYFFGIVL